MTKDEELSRLRLELMHYSEHMERKVCELNNIIEVKSQPKEFVVYTRAEDGTMSKHHVIQYYCDDKTIVLTIAEPK